MKLQKIVEPEETEESDSDKLINGRTEIKHVTDRKNHITMTMKIDATEKEIIVDTE